MFTLHTWDSMRAFTALVLFGIIALMLLVIVYFCMVVNNTDVSESLVAQPATNWFAGHTAFWKDGKVEQGLMVIVITLQKRLSAIQGRLAASGFANIAWFLKAHKGADLDLTQLQSDAIIDPSLITHLQGKKASNIIGCALSHLTALAYFQQTKNATHCLILEDDVGDPGPDALQQTLTHIKDSASNNWDMFYLGYKYEPSKLKRGEDIANHAPGIYWQLKSPLGGHAYIVSKGAVDKLLNLIVPLKKAIDEIYYDVIAAEKIKAFGLRDLLFKQDMTGFKSELGNGGGQDQFIYTP